MPVRNDRTISHVLPTTDGIGLRPVEISPVHCECVAHQKIELSQNYVF